MTKMSEHEVTKEKIISVCRDRFLREGFARISVDEIANDLAISKKTFYKHFSSKEDIVFQIVERIMGEIRLNINNILMSEKSAVEKLCETTTMLGLTARRLLPFFGQDVKKRLPELWKRIEDFRRERISEIFSRLMDQGVREGSMRADINKRLFFLSIFAVIDSIVQPQILVAESFSFADAIQGILAIFFRGVMTQTGVEQFERLMTDVLPSQ
jgi:AcrR family transcriptional regulator